MMLLCVGAPHSLQPELSFDSSSGSVTATVDGYGASVYLRLDPK